MGRTLLILLSGFAVSFGVLAMGKNSRLIESIDRMVGQLTDHAAQNAATSGAYLALNQVFLDRNWRGNKNFVLDGNTVGVAIKNDSVSGTPKAFHIRIQAASSGPESASGQTEVVVFDRHFKEFAVWAKDSVLAITTKNSSGVANDSLAMKFAPFMPKVDETKLRNVSQVNSTYNSGNLTVSSRYPSSATGYYRSSGIPHVTWVEGDLRIKTGATVYGIVVVKGQAQFEGAGNLEGVLVMTNTTSSRLRHVDLDPSQSLINGGLLTWGDVDGTGGNIVVQQFPTYLDNFTAYCASTNPPIRVLSWK